MQTPTNTPTTFTQRIERTVVMVVLAIEVPSIVMVVAVFLHSSAPLWAALVTAGAMLGVPLLLARSRLVVRLEDERLRWTFFPFWRGSVAYANVVAAEVVEVQAMRDFGGWGPKFGMSKSMKRTAGAIARSGPAVRVQRSGRKRDLVLTCDHADELCAALLERALHAQGAP